MMMERIVNNPLILPLLFSIVCGAMIGIERELKDKDAGIKTGVFICVGAALFAYISTIVPGVNDSSRVMAQIVSGIGFIGGGVIIYEKDKVQGLTSAAIMWMTAAIGILNGLGMYYEAIMSSLTIVIADKILDLFKRKIIYNRREDKENGDD